ncbi:MAG: hypothetical protein JNM17_29865 [Archangium sp.]|nr:hypothetical protein [Archangium sp.]
MNALVLAMVFSQAPVLEGSTAPKPPDFRLHVGGQVGFPFLLGVQSTGTFFFDGRPRFDVDATWEPSVTLQSYSVGGAYHVLDRFFFVGARLRLVQYQPPWARGIVELFFGIGADLGVRLRVGPEDKGVITIALHGTFIPGQASNLQTLLGLSAGFSWSVFEH